MAIQVAKLTREFVYNGVTFPDPGPTMSVISTPRSTRS
jgi:PRTRC genetic system protein C